MKALNTPYRGFLFRSRLEARWAYFWDQMGVEWEYEAEAYDLGDIRYLPDFRLPTRRLWVEIKGEVRDDQAGLRFIKQCSALAAQSACPVVLCFHDPYDVRCAVFRGDRMYSDARWGVCTVCGALTVAIKGVYLCRHEEGAAKLPPPTYRFHRGQLYNAAVAARQYRFGFVRK